jgi:hypothetical protein
MTLFSFCVFFLFASISHAKCVVMSRTARNASPMHLGVMHRFSFTLSKDFTNAHKRALSFVFTLLHRRHLFAVGVVVVFTHRFVFASSSFSRLRVTLCRSIRAIRRRNIWRFSRVTFVIKSRKRVAKR